MFFFKSNFFKSGLIYVITDSINKAIPFLLLPIITTYLAPEEFGIVTNFLILSSILMIFIGVNVDGAISANYYRLPKENLSRYITSTVFIIVAAFFIVLSLVYVFNGIIYSYIQIPLSYQLLTVIMSFFQIFTLVNLALWRLEEQPFKFGLYQVLQTLLNFGLSLYFIIQLKLGWTGRADGHLIAVTVFGVFSLIILFRRGYLNLDYRKSYIKDAVNFGLPLVPHSVSIWLRSGIDRVLITKLMGAAANGLYAVGFQFGILMGFLMTAFNNAFIPYLFRKLSVDDKEVLQQTKIQLVKMTYGIMILILMLCGVLTVVSHYVIIWFMPLSYLEATKFVFWALLAQSFQGMYLLVVNYIFYAKKTGFLALITFSCGIVQILLSYLFIKKWGAMGAAYAAALVSFINFIAVWIYSANVYPMPWLTIKQFR